MRGRPVVFVVLIALAGCTDDAQDLAQGPTADAGVRDASVPPDAEPEEAGAPLDAAAPDAAPMDAAAPDAAPTPDAGELAQVGDACAQNADCASNGSPNADLSPSPCFQEWPGGYCVDYCQLPADALGGTSLPQGDCPDGAVCLPRFDAVTPIEAERPEVGGCFQACTSDADCRGSGDFDPEYFCRRDFWSPEGGAKTFDNGYCAPRHCRSRGCPQSYICGC